MGKELSMVERNDKGRQARRYFIDMERRALQGKLDSGQLPSPTITKAQQGELHALIANKARSSGKPNAYYWSRFQNHFKLASYKDTPVDRFEEAKDYLTRLEGDGEDSFISISKGELQKWIEPYLLDLERRVMGAKTSPGLPANGRSLVITENQQITCLIDAATCSLVDTEGLRKIRANLWILADQLRWLEGEASADALEAKLLVLP